MYAPIAKSQLLRSKMTYREKNIQSVDCANHAKTKYLRGNEMKILGSHWFTQMGGQIIGIVIITNDAGETKAYIGTGFGKDQAQDEIRIASFGAKFPVELAETLITRKA
jgi:hypothetical protein